ncbi:MAG: hypothetical protein VKP63_07765 [Cyanobacteriota bacterium]|nr:hypothetical protein [Cyanobacteriota bacterium]
MMQLMKGWGGITRIDQRIKYLEREIMVHENDLALLPAGKEATDVERLKSEQIKGEINLLKTELAKLNLRNAKA